MARKAVNAKELAEKLKANPDAASTAAPKPAAKTATKRKTAVRKTATAPRTRKRTTAAAAEPRKLYWGIFNGMWKRVALYDFIDKDAAEAKLSELNKKAPHYLQKVKDDIKITAAAAEEIEEDVEPTVTVVTDGNEATDELETETESEDGLEEDVLEAADDDTADDDIADDEEE